MSKSRILTTFFYASKIVALQTLRVCGPKVQRTLRDFWQFRCITIEDCERFLRLKHEVFVLSKDFQSYAPKTSFREILMTSLVFN